MTVTATTTRTAFISRLSGYMFSDTESTYGEGQWTMTIQNDRINDFNIDQFVIRLYYK